MIKPYNITLDITALIHEQNEQTLTPIGVIKDRSTLKIEAEDIQCLNKEILRLIENMKFAMAGT